MSNFLFMLKGQATVLNLLLFLFFFWMVLRRYKRIKAATWTLIIIVSLFLLTSTSYLPVYLTRELERQYPVFKEPLIVKKGGKVLIHVLGSGYSLDKDRSATTQLGPAATGRLLEGIRIFRLFDSAILITSGNSMRGLESQASVAKRAAIEIGISKDKIEVIETPSTTQEEVRDLALKFGVSVPVIVVTDAMHMPRAITLFKHAGFTPIAAPANFKTHDMKGFNEWPWWPKIANQEQMDLVLHEYLGNLKAWIKGEI